MGIAWCVKLVFCLCTFLLRSLSLHIFVRHCFMIVVQKFLTLVFQCDSASIKQVWQKHDFINIRMSIYVPYLFCSFLLLVEKANLELFHKFNLKVFMNVYVSLATVFKRVRQSFVSCFLQTLFSTIYMKHRFFFLKNKGK